MESRIIQVVVISTFLVLSVLFPLLSLAYSTTSINPSYPQSNVISALPSNTNIILYFFIPPKNLNELYLIAQEVANHQIKPLSNAQLVSMFSNQDKVNESIKYLESKGFTIIYRSPFEIMAEAPVSLVSSVFETSFVLAKSTNGEIYYKPAGNVKIPSTLNNLLIGGLTNFTNVSLPLIQLGKLENGNLIPNKQAYSSFVYTFQFSATWYTPKVIEGAYNITPLLNSTADKKVTIAIIDAYGDPEIYQDVNLFDARFGLPPINLTVLPVGPYHPENGLFTGWFEEVALDVEAAHAAAPYSNILLVVAPSATLEGLFSAIDVVVSEDLAQVVSMSWGLPGILFGASGFYAVFNGIIFPNYPYYDYYFELGSAEGITFLASSGDLGAYNDLPTVYGSANYPASSPFVTAVGGTSLFANITSGYISTYNSTGNFGAEIAWSVNPLYFGVIQGGVSSGGGYSQLFPAPWYQRYVTHSNYRAIPDVAADANPYTGFTIYALGQEVVIGGTSLSAPLWAGIIADIDGIIGHPLGLVNPILYEIYQNTTLYHQAFHQISLGYNGYYYANSSYNLVTGLGSPNAGMLGVIIKHSLSKSLAISVSTFETGVFQPWYFYGSTFTIAAYITYPNNTIVSQGSFNAYIYTSEGYLATVPLSFNGSYWVGNYTITPNNPPNLWEIVVNGSSDQFTGVGTVEVDVGESINIVSPIPYPYSFPIPYNSPFGIEAWIYYPNGTPVVNQSVTAYLVSNDGKLLASIPLTMMAPGLYEGSYALLPPLPQGTYLLIVNDSYGSAFSYVYFGEYNFGAILTPINDGFPAASPGQNITIIDEVLTPELTGLFTSNVTAYIYNQHGNLIDQVKLTPAPDEIQFGVYLLFFLYYANFTIPFDASPGFYNVVIQSISNTSTGLVKADFITSFYVSPANLTLNVKVNNVVYEGELLKIFANITYPNGTPVKYGMFTATILPTSLNYEQLIIGFEAGIPLQYNSTLGEWVGIYSIPSIFYGSIFQGSSVYSLAGPWNVIVSGVSWNGYNLYSTPSSFNFVNVMPYTFINNIVVSSKSLDSPLLSKINSTTYMLSNVKSNNITINGMNVILSNVIANTVTVKNSNIMITSSTINQLVLDNSSVSIIGSKIGGDNIAVVANDSNVTIVSSVIQDSKYAFLQPNSVISLSGVNMYNVTSLSSIPAPRITYLSTTNVTTSKESIIVNITGEYLRLLGVSMNNKPVGYSVISSSPSSISLSIPFNASQLSDGQYIFTVSISDGLPYNLTFNLLNNYHLIIVQDHLKALQGSVNLLTVIAIISLIIAIIAVALLFVFTRRR
ncbi:peptidase S53 [Saccharolobus solfataricus]|uniref:Serine protease, subtilase family, putative n=3 Tax=Saccharolobus solfataricus TaxID=2287 RepID=Q97VR2_SACS2|nr:protease pro-enzyme activation domain-containing protein [Saccharolobus solfataricus]AAK42680.1 Serine protease, subtilase family, putative [Saccharolobus solfataricus P2]AKA72776.1 peptidase S53 [Saccharolobus solfataricus]AKA75475.1 peptidase S53 [Saccharolobus solfataricus]AKA78168.1 peptidase S53 [Saccharolobus solfataricus]AZF67285.1 peptidase S53 [Saccharolobus solfataricus]